MKSKFMTVKRIVMPVMQALILVQTLCGCGTVDRAQFQELLDTADDVSVEMYVGSLSQTGESYVWMAQTGVNSIANAEAKGMASNFISAFNQLKPAQTLMDVMQGNQNEAKYFMEPNAQLQSTSDKSAEFQKTYTAAVSMYNQINADQLDVNDTVSKLVKASLGSQVYYNTWSASFNSDGSHIANDFYNGQITQLDLILSVYNAIYGYEAVPNDDCLYGTETDSKIEAFKQTLSDVQSKISDNESTDRQKDLSKSIDNMLNQQDFDNTVRKLMYMTKYTEINPFENVNLADSIYFSNATKMDAVSLVYNVVRDLQSSIDESLKNKDYSTIKASELGSEFKDLNGQKLLVKSTDEVYEEATGNGKVSTERDKINVVREYQNFKAMSVYPKDITLTADQWAIYQDVKDNTSILNNINQTNTADYRLLGSLQVTDLYSMLLGASSDLKGYSNELSTDTLTGSVENIDEQDQIRTYDFDSYILQYEKDNNLTDEEIQADENLKLAMFEWLRDAGVQVGLAVNDKYSGCENIFLDDYIKWLDPDSTIDQYGQKPESTGASSAFTEEEMAEMGVEPEPKVEDFIKDGKFLQDEYNAAYAEWHEGASKAFEEYQQKKTDEAMAETNKKAEEMGFDVLDQEEINQMWKEGEEFGNKVAEVIENGTIEEILNNVNN